MVKHRFAAGWCCFDGHTRGEPGECFSVESVVELATEGAVFA